MLGERNTGGRLQATTFDDSAGFVFFFSFVLSSYISFFLFLVFLPSSFSVSRNTSAHTQYHLIVRTNERTVGRLLPQL